VKRRDTEQNKHEQLTGYRRVYAWTISWEIRLAENKAREDPSYSTK
jgi:hypothetical protein